MSKLLRLQQGQVWKLGDIFLRIVRLERLAVEYKAMTSLDLKGGSFHQATKKQFCRLLKSAVLQPARAGAGTPPPTLTGGQSSPAAAKPSTTDPCARP